MFCVYSSLITINISQRYKINLKKKCFMSKKINIFQFRSDYFQFSNINRETIRIICEKIATLDELSS